MSEVPPVGVSGRLPGSVDLAGIRGRGVWSGKPPLTDHGSPPKRRSECRVQGSGIRGRRVWSGNPFSM